MSAQPWLVFASVAGIQDWITGHATELQIIRGGSVLLDAAFERAEVRLRDEFGEPSALEGDAPRDRWAMIGRSSGQLSAVFSDVGDAEEAVVLLRSDLEAALPGAAVSVGSAQLSGETEEDRAPFASARIRARSVARSDSSRALPSYVLGTDTCDATGVDSALARSTFNEGWHLSASAEARRKAGTTGLEHPGVELARDMSEIGGQTPRNRWAGYVGVISADGNAIGERFRSISTAAALREESAKVHAAVKRAIDEALTAAADEHRERTGRDEKLKVNPVVVAGDDLRFVVPGHVALTFAAALCSAAPDLQASAGVLLCHSSLPFAIAHAAAEKLQKQAKTVGMAAKEDAPPAMVAFDVESGANTNRTLGSHPLTLSPYRAEHIAAVLEAADHVDASNSALQRVRDAVVAGGRMAEREWELFVRTRLSSADREALARLWTAVGDRDVLETPFPTDPKRSPLGDLLLLRSLRSVPITPAAEEVPA